MQQKAHIRDCEWHRCPKEGRYRIQASSDMNDIHWFCALHARTFDLSVVSSGPFFGSAGPNWTQEQKAKSKTYQNYSKPYPDINKSVRMKHATGEKLIEYTREDIANLKVLGLDTGANLDEIKKAYKTLVKHCHPDQNPDLEHGTYIFTKVTEAYNALKEKDFNK
ncbi:J domain-containing protein [Pseudemcibacter aquimaris]|uniref:J domain-containing protein n=1 Tax=Pseudemcibacter aquimaris TaxID=2857064 RepID=UPI00201196D2|nr:J domain-containing protein [Pseudemcibacter aquimaris]MCC3860302.1 DnaJ domain-containing protein [Pseudemcibacter aquimaris]WDU57626.1 DnaJ domain-containing protein [Pseudemcibacter aquimaris]